MLSGSGRIRIMKVVGCGAVFAAFILIGKLHFSIFSFGRFFIASVSKFLGGWMLSFLL
jgi:hypothetical protein